MIADDIGAELRRRVARYGWEQVPLTQLRDQFDSLAHKPGRFGPPTTGESPDEWHLSL